MKPSIRPFNQVFLLAILQSQISHAQLAWDANGTGTSASRLFVDVKVNQN